MRNKLLLNLAILSSFQFYLYIYNKLYKFFKLNCYSLFFFKYKSIFKNIYINKSKYYK